MNWVAVHAIVQTFAIAHNAYLVADADLNELFLYEKDKIIFQPAKLSILPCSRADSSPATDTPAFCVHGPHSARNFPPVVSTAMLEEQLKQAWAGHRAKKTH